MAIGKIISIVCISVLCGWLGIEFILQFFAAFDYGKKEYRQGYCRGNPYTLHMKAVDGAEGYTVTCGYSSVESIRAIVFIFISICISLGAFLLNLFFSHHSKVIVWVCVALSLMTPNIMYVTVMSQQEGFDNTECDQYIGNDNAKCSVGYPLTLIFMSGLSFLLSVCYMQVNEFH